MMVTLDLADAPNRRMQPDRFAREIVGILALLYVARLRRLMRKAFGRSHHYSFPFST
jgi:hypothetical protein